MTGPPRNLRMRMALSAATPLHVATARIALANWLLARHAGGHIALRLDDPPPGRDPPDPIRHDLRWLGLDWDAEDPRPGRDAGHAAAAALQAAGRLYPCFESEAELAARRDRRLRRGQPAAYDRAMLKLTPAQREAAEAGGKRPHWRFRLSDETITWDDLALGRRSEHLPSLSDPVLLRADGTPTPAFAGAVDDLAEGITHIVRSADLTGLTAIQLDLRAALGGAPCAFAHLPALADPAGDRLSRRTGNLSVRSLRQHGVQPEALAAYLAGLGGNPAGRPMAPAALAPSFRLAGTDPAPPRFDLPALLALNRQALAALPFAAVADRLPHGATEAFWNAVRGSLDLLTEARGYWEVVAGTIVPPVVEGEAAFLREALAQLPAEPWDDGVWTEWTAALRHRTGRSGRSVTLPLRLALTGEEQGPDLKALLPLIGRPRAAQRLAVAAS